MNLDLVGKAIMENFGFYMMYVVEGIFVLLLIYAGGLSYKFPMNYQTALEYIAPEGKYFGTLLRYPHFSSKRALSTKEAWDFAQKTYGKYLLIFAAIQAIIGVFWHQIAELAINFTKWSEAGMVIIICPIIVFFLMANILTEIKLKKLKLEK